MFTICFLRSVGKLYHLIPNRTFLVHMSFFRALINVSARINRAEIHTARPNDPDMSPKRTKEERLFIHRTKIRPSDDIVAISGH